MNTYLEVDEQDRKFLFEAICHYDMHKDEYFDTNENDSFHSLYSKLNPYK